MVWRDVLLRLPPKPVDFVDPALIPSRHPAVESDRDGAEHDDRDGLRTNRPGHFRMPSCESGEEDQRTGDEVRSLAHPREDGLIARRLDARVALPASFGPDQRNVGPR